MECTTIAEPQPCADDGKVTADAKDAFAAARVRQKNMERARKTRQRKKIQLNTTQSKFSALMNYTEFLNSFIKDNFLVSKTIVPNSEARASNPHLGVSICENKTAEGLVARASGGEPIKETDLSGHPIGSSFSHEGQGPSETPPPPHLLRYSQPSLKLPVEITEIEITRSSITNPKISEAVEKLRIISTSVEIKEIQDYLLTPRFAMPIVTKSLGDSQMKNDPGESLSFRKERSRLHAQLSRMRKKQFIDRLVKANEDVENAVTAFRASLLEAGIALPALDNRKSAYTVAENVSGENSFDFRTPYDGQQAGSDSGDGDSSSEENESVACVPKAAVKRRKIVQ